jgi:hypothetical protein
MAKTKQQILEENKTQLEIDNFDQEIIIKKLNCLSSLLETNIADGSEYYSSAFNQKGLDVITNKIIELVKRIE